MTQQNTWLTDELTAKTTELGKLRQSSTEITCKLKSELAQKSEETAFLNVSTFFYNPIFLILNSNEKHFVFISE